MRVQIWIQWTYPSSYKPWTKAYNRSIEDVYKHTKLFNPATEIHIKCYKWSLTMHRNRKRIPPCRRNLANWMSTDNSAGNDPMRKYIRKYYLAQVWTKRSLQKRLPKLNWHKSRPRSKHISSVLESFHNSNTNSGDLSHCVIVKLSNNFKGGSQADK